MKVTPIVGFATGMRRGRSLGPSAVSLAGDVAYIGNRATGELCTVDARLLAKMGCVTLAVPSDGVQAVPATREAWVTTPVDRSITIVDVSNAESPRVKSRIFLAGDPEGYALDEGRGLFFTNLEDKDQTLVIDVRSHRVVERWKAHCGDGGPRGLAYDQTRQLLFVACTDHVAVLAAGGKGTLLATLATGGGVDNIDYLEERQALYVAAGKAARLTVAHVDGNGQGKVTLTVAGTATTAEGSRVVVAAPDGTAVVADPGHGRLLVFAPSQR
jgi:hypothetical protein